MVAVLIALQTNQPHTGLSILFARQFDHSLSFPGTSYTHAGSAAAEYENARRPPVRKRSPVRSDTIHSAPGRKSSFRYRTSGGRFRAQAPGPPKAADHNAR